MAKSILDTQLPYDRSAVRPGILHIGAGRFHRAHEALYCHELLSQGQLNWGISAAFLLPFDQPSVSGLRKQNGLYTLTERDSETVNRKVIGSIVEVLDGSENPASVVERIADPDIKIITYTVTEAGYYIDPATKQLMVEHPHIATAIHSEQPSTLYGFLAAGLKLRQDRQLPPVTLQSCDNIQGNGDFSRSLFLEFLNHWDAHRGSTLIDWVKEHITFPNSMVDRITPAATREEQTQALEAFGFEDTMAVTSETYLQWVIEDKYANGRPDWAQVGVQMTDNIKPYEQIKVRLLNAGHTAIGYCGVLHGLETIGEIVSQPDFNQFLWRFFSQAEKTLPVLPDIDLPAYQKKLIQRFSNPAIVDQALRICKDGSAKIPGFIIPTLSELMAKDLPHDTFAYILASYWYFLDQQIKQSGGSQGIDDPESEHLFQLVQTAQGSMQVFLSDASIFGQIADEPKLVQLCQDFADKMQEEGIIEALPAD